MGKSVKLTDGSYIDAEGVYDVTKCVTQSTLNARIGTVLRSGPDGSATLTDATSTICSITLTEGTWLLIGVCLNHGGIRLSFSPSSVYQLVGAEGDRTDSTEAASHVFGVTTGAKTVSFLATLRTAKSLAVTNDWRYWGVIAICIG